MKTTTKVLIIACIVGLSLLLYPNVANYWNEIHATHAINNYVNNVGSITPQQFREMWEKAVLYNEKLNERENMQALTDEMREEYYQTLDFSGTGVMGYIDISKLGVSLPIYHGTSAEVLQIAVGHVEWTSLPVGGKSTHCVVSGHRGLPSAKLFTDLDRLREGDTFTITILTEVLTYEVDQIRIVLPSEVNSLKIEPGEDYCTLVTCTPYGINTHRLLVRGRRIETTKGSVVVVAEGVEIDPLVVAPVVEFPLLFILFMRVMLKKPEKKYKHDVETIQNLLNNERKGSK